MKFLKIVILIFLINFINFNAFSEQSAEDIIKKRKSLFSENYKTAKRVDILSKDLELSALKNGGKIIGYNNAHYGNVNALLSEGRGTTMGDGWETRRRRVPGNDFIIIELGTPGLISNVEIDTCHFKGNFPDRASIQTIDLKNEKDKNKTAWKVLEKV